MDSNDYVLARDVHDRLAHARAAAVRRALVPRRARRRLRVALGAALVALGERLLAPAPAPRRGRA
ncbi:MAG TPA: hypothetical protein VEA38_22235 [Terriglobales bacterium]|nr:hypothetical protein [Terriglobales bacterium]